jgi:hypothetical protein
MRKMPAHEYMGYTVFVNAMPARNNRYYSVFLSTSAARACRWTKSPSSIRKALEPA